MANLNPKDTWSPQVLGSHPLFWPLIPDAVNFVESFNQWPALSDYQKYLDHTAQPITTRSQQPLAIVPQGENPQQFSDGYEPRIFLKGELQTRQASWHDFFQVLVWKLFPKTKSILNELHFNAIKDRMYSSSTPQQRTILENTLTQFDECGGIIISTDDELLKMIQQFDWHSLFWKNRSRLEQQLKCIVFGHAIYEKALNPYIGLTSHCILLNVPQNIFLARTKKLMEHIDTRLEALFTDGSSVRSPQDLSPFPILGLPGWHPGNNQESFYENKEYFRPGRKQKNQFPV